MEKWQIVATVQMSAGNETVGEMWAETKVFDCDVETIKIFEWAASLGNNVRDPEHFRRNITLTVAQ